MSQAFSNNNNSFNIRVSNYISPDDESKILAWLSPLEPWVRHRDIGAQRLDTVGGWVLETKEFRSWHNGGGEDESKRGILFCEGNPGVGKSYIASLVIDKLCNEAVGNHTAVTCFYFDFASRNEQSPINMLGSLLRQLVSGLEGIPEVVAQTFQNEKKVIGGRGLQVSGILEMFHTIAATKRTFICIDALDECAPEHRAVVLESLRQILLASPNTCAFITGRPHVRNEVERKLDRGATFILIQPTEEGFITYLREKLRNDTSPDTMSPKLEADIMRSIPEISSETFLLASLHIEAVLRETTIARRGKRLRLLEDGGGLEGAYGGTLERIRSQDSEKTKLAIATLTWICYAERPLLVDELCHALAVEIGATGFDQDNVPSIGALLSCCQGLITVDKEASTVRLIHITVREYLCAHPNLFDKPHTTITEACLTYLNSIQVKDLSSHLLPNNRAMSFLNYSSRYWGTHAKRELSDHARNLALELLSQYEGHVSAQSLLRQVLRPDYIGLMGNLPLFSGLHCASFFGNVELVTTLLNGKRCNINQGDFIMRVPLSWAARMGHEEVVKILLRQENVDPDPVDIDGGTPLGNAAFAGHGGVVKLLLGCADVDPNREDSRGATPLLLAAYSGHVGVTKLLLDREDVDPNFPYENGRTPLGIAAFEGHEGVAKLLLERANVDPNWQDDKLSTPLSLVAYNGHEGITKLLLDREDVDPNHPDEDGELPLGIAAFQGHEGMVKLLLERADVDPNWQDNKLRTPLLLAAYNGHMGVTKILLDREDVDPNRPYENGLTPLGIAAFQGHEGVVKLLLEHADVEPNWQDNELRTPLSLVAYNGHEGVTKLLLDREDVDPNRPYENGRTPLGIAAFEGHEGVVKLLLERADIDPNWQDNKLSTPLSLVAYNGHEGITKLPLNREDVDPNHSDEDGRTPLGTATFGGHEGVVKLLLGRADIDPNRQDTRGTTPLLLAAYSGHVGVTKLLLDQEVINPNHPDMDGQTPLGWAARNGHEGVVKLLLGKEDAEPEKPDNQNRTPFLWATKNGHEGVVKLLHSSRDVAFNRSGVEGHEGVIKPLPRRDNVNPSHPAESGHKVVKPLQRREDAGPGWPDNQNSTPRSSAISHEREGVMKSPIGRENAVPNRPRVSYRTPLQYAVEGCEAALKSLPNPDCVAPKRLEENDRTPFQFAAGEPNESVIPSTPEQGNVTPTPPDVNDRTRGCGRCVLL